jgi:intein/homing endonuclease
MKAKYLTDFELRTATELYQNGQSFMTISRKLGYSDQFIRKVLNKNGVASRKLHEINRKHSVNESYFDNIDTEEKAYFLGLLFADGNVNTKYNAVVLKLQQKDELILSRFSHVILNKKLLYKSENNILVKFSSYHIKQQLISLGCIPNKSLKLQWPKWLIDSELQRHFIRGYFDGDGCLTQTYLNFCIGIVSTQQFCESIIDIIFTNTNIIGTIHRHKAMLERGNNITCELVYGGNRRVIKVMNWLYQDATIYLERKHDIYLQLIERVQDVDRRHGNHYVNQYL